MTPAVTPEPMRPVEALTLDRDRFDDGRQHQDDRSHERLIGENGAATFSDRNRDQTARRVAGDDGRGRVDEGDRDTRCAREVNEDLASGSKVSGGNGKNILGRVGMDGCMGRPDDPGAATVVIAAMASSIVSLYKTQCLISGTSSHS